jgi:hypothetical protein
MRLSETLQAEITSLDLVYWYVSWSLKACQKWCLVSADEINGNTTYSLHLSMETKNCFNNE